MLYLLQEVFELANHYFLRGRGGTPPLNCKKKQVIYIYFYYYIDCYLQEIDVLCIENKVKLSWKVSPYFADLKETETYISIKKRGKDADEWKEVQTNVQVSDQLCPLSTDEPENSEFMVELFVKETSGPCLIEWKIVSGK